jgi:hypothetical protein
VTEDASTTTPTESFDTFWLKGLGWGFLAGTTTAWLALAVALTPAEGITFAGVFGQLVLWIIAMTYASMAAIMLTIVPIAPAAALFGWSLYRAGVRSRWAYAAAGAAAAMTAPLLIALVSRTTAPPLINLSDLLVFRVGSPAVVVFTWFALAGAFGGFMAARALRRARA